MSGIREIWPYANNIIRSARQMINEDLAPLGLGSAEGNILIQLLTQQIEVRQDEVVELLDISKPAVSRALDSLEQKGYVVRTRDPSDRRAVLVLLTDKAREIGPRVLRIYDEVFSVGAEVVSEQEIRDVIDLFARVSDSYTRTRALRRQRKVK